MKDLSIVVALMFFHASLVSQIIWSEDFSYVDGTVAGADNNAPVGADWTSSCPTCIAPNDWFEVRTNKMEGRDTNGPGELLTEIIDISAYPLGVEFTIDIEEIGIMEGCLTTGGTVCDFECVDWVNVAYSLNGGAFVEVTTPSGGACGGTYTWASGNYAAIGDFTPFTVVQSGLIGTSLQIRASVQNWAGAETHYLDNIVVNQLNVLPVELLSFEGSTQGQQVALSWEVAEESNVDKYIVRRKVAEENGFESIGTISAQALDSYTFDDELLLSESARYQLKIVALNGTYSLSKTIEVGRKREQLLRLYPNPASGYVRFEHAAVIHEIEVFDFMGRKLKQAHPLETTYELDTSDLVPAMYQYRIRADKYELTGSFVKW